MNGKLMVGVAMALALGACSARDEGNGSTVISVDKNAVQGGLNEAGAALKDAGNEVKDAADKAAPAVKDAADKAGSEIGNAADASTDDGFAFVIDDAPGGLGPHDRCGGHREGR